MLNLGYIMPLNNDEMTKEILQTHCDQIITQLEKAVQAAVYAKHFKSNNASDVQKTIEAAEQTKNNYFQTAKSLYRPKDLPLLYTEVYNCAISRPTRTSYRSHDFSEDGHSHSTEAYTIKAGRIIRQLNDDFLPNQQRDSWVSYNKPHLNCVGKVTNKRVGAPDYQMRWMDGSQEAPEEKKIYLDIMKDGLFYAVLDPDNQIKTGKISLDRILGMSLQEDQFNNSEDDLIYAEIEVNSGHIRLKNITPFSVITEEDEQPLDLQEQCTAIIDRLINAVYAEMYRKYLPENIDAVERTNAETDAHNRYEFYIRTVKKLYGSDPIPKKFESIYQDAIHHASFNRLGKLLRHPIKVGGILSQLNNDFVLINQEDGIKWLIYNKPYLDFSGNTINQPIGTGVYQPIDLIKHADGLTYRVRSPSGDIQTGKLSLDNILALVEFEHIERPDDHIYVEISEVRESPAAYCYSFIMHILSHPIVQIVAIALLVIGAALALSGIAVGIGAAMAISGGGILIAGFFAPKRSQENDTLTPGFFAPSQAQESSPFEVNRINGMMAAV